MSVSLDESAGASGGPVGSRIDEVWRELWRKARGAGLRNQPVKDVPTERLEHRKEYRASNKLAILEYAKEYYARNRGKILAYHKEYGAKNKDAILARAREYYANNKAEEMGEDAHSVARKELRRAKNQEKQARWKAKNPEKVKRMSEAYLLKTKDKRKARYVNNRPAMLAYSKAYKAKNRDKARDWAHRRRDRKANGDCKKEASIAQWTRAWKKRRSVRCYWCNDSFAPKSCHSDHIVALAIGGRHSSDNMCISCSPCNLSKSARPLNAWNSMITSPVLAL